MYVVLRVHFFKIPEHLVQSFLENHEEVFSPTYSSRWVMMIRTLSWQVFVCKKLSFWNQARSDSSGFPYFDRVYMSGFRNSFSKRLNYKDIDYRQCTNTHEWSTHRHLYTDVMDDVWLVEIMANQSHTVTCTKVSMCLRGVFSWWNISIQHAWRWL